MVNKNPNVKSQIYILEEEEFKEIKEKNYQKSDLSNLVNKAKEELKIIKKKVILLKFIILHIF